MKRDDKPPPKLLDGAARRRFLLQASAGAGTLFLAGCDKLSQSQWFPKVLDSAVALNQHIQQALGPSTALAPEYNKAGISPVFRPNGTTNPNNPVYQKLAANGFKDWQLKVDGLVEQPLHLSLATLQTAPARAQITRHDCVEGWSVIGQRTGVGRYSRSRRWHSRSRRRATWCFTARPDGRRQRSLLRESEPESSRAAADDSRLSSLRPAATDPQRRAATAARTAPTRLQDG